MTSEDLAAELQKVQTTMQDVSRILEKSDEIDSIIGKTSIRYSALTTEVRDANARLINIINRLTSDN